MARWAQVRVERPDVEPALPLHQALISTQIGLLDDAEVRAATVHDPADTAQVLEHLVAGRRVIDKSPMAPRAAFAAMHDLARLLADHRAGEAASKIGAALAGSAGLVAFDASCLRDVDAMRALAQQHGLNLQVLWLIAEVASAPVVHLRQRALLEDSGEAVRDAIASGSAAPVLPAARGRSSPSSSTESGSTAAAIARRCGLWRRASARTAVRLVTRFRQSCPIALGRAGASNSAGRAAAI